MDSPSSLPVKEPEVVSSVCPRRRPLHTFGVSILTIVEKFFSKAQELSGPIGSISKRVAKLIGLFFPIIHTIQERSLSALSFTDDFILAVERTIEIVFPPSIHLFNKADDLVKFTETLPGKLDEIFEKFPVIMQEVPFKNGALLLLVSGLKALISFLNEFGSASVKEKEIMVDTSSEEPTIGSEMVDTDEKGENLAYSTYEPTIAVSKTEDQPESSIVNPSNDEKYDDMPKSSLEKKKPQDEDETFDDEMAGRECEVKMQKLESESEVKTQKLESESEVKTEKKERESEVKTEKEVEEAIEEGKEKVGASEAESSEKMAEQPLLDLFETNWLMR